MTIVAITETKGDPKELLVRYDKVGEQMAKGQPAPGLISHTCVELDDGIRVVNMYETEEQARAGFQRPEFLEALRSAGVPELSPEFRRVHNYRIFKTS